MDMFRWPVVPICERQLRDVNPDDLLEGGLYRRCNTYKGGGGYDRFPAIYRSRFGGGDVPLNDQFVVQLRGCPLRCPYCYVTRDGIDGHSIARGSDELAQAFEDSGCSVFHLMGGAPALYLEHWPELLDALDGSTVFHSDLLLVEKPYSCGVLEKLSGRGNSLYAVSIKGATPSEFRKNTATGFAEGLFWENFDAIVETSLPFYLTFTGMSEDGIAEISGRISKRYGEAPLDGCFAINLVEYEALR